MTDLYADLGIPRSASPEEVKKAYRRRAKKTHPDTEGGSQEKFAQVQRAYMVLSDQKSRDSYDKTGDADAASEPDNSEAKAREVVVSCVVNAIRASERVTFSEDIFLGIRQKTLEPAIQKIFQNIAQHQRSIALNEKFLARVKRKKRGGPDLVKALVEGMTAELHRNIARAKEDIAIHERAIKILAEYEYEFEQQQMVTFNDFQSSGSAGAWFKV
jgi:curved DNA-binding protein CbpA